MTFDSVLQQLHTEGYLAQPTVTLPTATEEHTPWYIKLAMGISGWFAALFIMFFLTISIFAIDSAVGNILLGLIFCGLTAGLRYRKPDSTFIQQGALAFCLVGQMLYCYGVATLSEKVFAVTIAMILLEIVLILIYRDDLLRFLSVLVIAGFGWGLLAFEWEWILASRMLIGLLMLAALPLWLFESQLVASKVENISRPLGYGLIVSAFALLTWYSFETNFDLLTDMPLVGWWPLSLSLWLMVIGVMGFIQHQSRLKLTASHQAILLGGTLLLLIPAWQVPGILAAWLGLLLGFWRGNRLLMGISVAFLGLFIGVFYYNLELTLLYKSIILLATGLLCLAVRYGLKISTTLERGDNDDINREN